MPHSNVYFLINCFRFDGAAFQVSDEIKEQAKKW